MKQFSQCIKPLAAAALAAGLNVGAAEGAFVEYIVVSTPIASGTGAGLTRHEVFARFNGATDTVLNVFNFQAQSGWGAHTDAASGFWHKDNSDYSGGVLGQAYGTWAPQVVGSATLNRPFDSFLLIGGNALGTNSTSADPSWIAAGGPGSVGWSQAQLPTYDIPNANTLGWFNTSPPNNQGRVGVTPNTATDVKLGQFMLASNDSAFRTYSLRVAYNNGIGGSVVFADATFRLCESRTYYRDLDGDGFGAAASGLCRQQHRLQRQRSDTQSEHGLVSRLGWRRLRRSGERHAHAVPAADRLCAQQHRQLPVDCQPNADRLQRQRNWRPVRHRIGLVERSRWKRDSGWLLG